MLASSAGQFGDVHIQDVSTILNRRRSMSGHAPIKMPGKLPTMVRKANEKLQVRAATRVVLSVYW